MLISINKKIIFIINKKCFLNNLFAKKKIIGIPPGISRMHFLLKK